MMWQAELAAYLKEDLTSCQFFSCRGGSINQAFKLELKNGKCYFVKHLADAKNDFFSAEAQGLKTLKKLSPLRVPQTITHSPSFLCLEWIDPQHPSGDFFESFAQGLAEQHRHTAPSWGFGQHNYIGSLKQNNSPEDAFVDFFWEQRLEVQIRQCSFLNKSHLDQFSSLANRLDILLDTPEEKPALIHGDLWSGNFLCDHNNQAVLIDPAVAYSHREMELAFTEIFGGFSSEFYQSYEAVFPLSPGYADRKDIYNLYPLMVHVNLFGTSYLKQVEDILKKHI